MSKKTIITSKKLKVPHGFLTRHGGVSGGIYQSLNCGYRHDKQGEGFDPKENTDENRRRALEIIGGPAGGLCLTKQVHGDRCLVVDKPGQGFAKADALVTNKPGLVLGVQTADCAPVLLYEEEAKIIGAAHAGWRGALMGVLESTVKAMESVGANKKKIVAVIGPTVDQASYQVGGEVLADFKKEDQDSTSFFKADAQPDKFLFDLPGYVAHRLRRVGVGEIEHVGLSTYKNEDMFFSCRRAFHQGLPGFGNQLSLIFMKTE